MEVQRTIPISVQPDWDVLKTIQQFNFVQQRVSHFAFEGHARRIEHRGEAGDADERSRMAAAGERRKPPSAIALHHACYDAVKGRVSAQMTATAIRLDAGAYQSAWRKGHPLRRRFAFRCRLAVWLVGERGRDASFPEDGTLSLWTVAGRKRLPFTVPPHFRDRLARAVCVNSLTIMDARAEATPTGREDEEGIRRENDETGEDNRGVTGRRLRAWLTVTVEVPDPAGHTPVGIDRGAVNALVAVDGDDRVLFVSGREHQARNERSRACRLQAQRKKAAHKARRKDTHSLRRFLKRLSRKQQNRTRTFARQAARALCKWAPPGAVFVLEGLRMPAHQPARRDQTRGRLSAWFHGLLRQCIENKAQERGVPLVTVHPAFTSLNCSPSPA